MGIKDMDILSYNIYEISELINNGFKIARLANNREFNDKALNAKKKSLKAKAQLQTAVVDFAQKAIDQGLEVIDFETGEKVPEDAICQTLVLLEGNHRYKAYRLLQAEDVEFDGKFYVTLPLTEDMKIAEMISEMNICICAWKGTDYVRGAIMSQPESVTKILNYMSELERDGYSLPAISRYITGTDSIKKSTLQKFMDGEVPEMLKDTDERLANIERCKKVLSAAQRFGKIIKTRSFADWVNSKLVAIDNLTGREVTERLVNFFSQLKDDEVSEIIAIKGKKGEQTKEDAINSRLNELYRLCHENYAN